MYQQKCPIYQNSKAVRDMVLLLMLVKGVFLFECRILRKANLYGTRTVPPTTARQACWFLYETICGGVMSALPMAKYYP
jgi:hypothetical protein